MVLLVGLLLYTLLFFYYSTFGVSKWKPKVKIVEQLKVIEKVVEKQVEIYRELEWSGNDATIVYPNFITGNIKCNTTIVSQFTFQRLNRLEMQVTRWTDCFSVGLFVTKKEFEKFNNLNNLKEHLLKFKFNNQVDIHLCFGDSYKINTMRNLSIKYSKSEIIFILDIDWIISEDLQKQVIKYGNPKSKVPYAFITMEYACSRLSLDSCNVTNYYPHGQHMSDYEKWKISEEPYEVIYNFPYEPYIIVNKSEIPEFSPKFDFGGNDKVSFLFELGILGYKFKILPSCYLAHFPHIDIEHWSTRSFERAVEQYHIFIKEMRIKYPGKVIRDHYLWMWSICATKTCTAAQEEAEKRREILETSEQKGKVLVEKEKSFKTIYPSSIPLFNPNRTDLVNQICLSDDLIIQEKQTKDAFKNCKYAKNGGRIYDKRYEDGFSLPFHEGFFVFLEFVHCQIPFGFQRWGDGEHLLAEGWPISKDSQAFKRDKWHWKGGKGKVSQDLKKSLTAVGNYFYGLPCERGYINALRYAEEHIDDRLKSQFRSNSLHFMGSNGYLFNNFMADIIEKKLAQSVILIISQTTREFHNDFLQFAHDVYYMSDEGPIQYEENRDTIVDQIQAIARAHTNSLFLISAGPIAKIMVYEMWQASKCNQYVDVGSALDEYTKVKPVSRRDQVKPWPEYTCKRHKFIKEKGQLFIKNEFEHDDQTEYEKK